jgi:hypothetical protein
MPGVEYYLAEADRFLQLAKAELADGPQYRKFMEMAQEYRCLAGIQQHEQAPAPDGGH